MTGEVGEGWEGVKDLALALSAHTSPRNSPRVNDNNDAAGGSGVIDTVHNTSAENSIHKDDGDNGSRSNNGTAAGIGGGGMINGNRARSMFAQRLKASSSTPISASSVRNQQHAEG